jgi:hypothetical protein
MKKTLLATALIMGTAMGFSETSYRQMQDLMQIRPNLTQTEFKIFMGDVGKLTRSYSSGLCAKFTTALLDNLHARNVRAFPQLDLREGRLVQGRQGRQTYPVTTSNNGILYAKNYKNVFESKHDFVKIGRKEVMQLPENTIVIAVYQPKHSRNPGHMEVLFKKNKHLYAASDKLGKPLFFYKNIYRQVDFYYPIREDGKI